MSSTFLWYSGNSSMQSSSFNLDNESIRNRSNVLLTGKHFRPEEILRPIQPSVVPFQRSPSPPSDRFFNFPSLLECLAEPFQHNKMPGLGYLSASEDTPEPQGPSQQLSSTVELSSSSPPSLSRVFAQQHPTETTSEETDRTLLRNEFQLNDIDDDLKYALSEMNKTVTHPAYQKIIDEAMDHFTDSRPPFCVKAPEEWTKSVMLYEDDGIVEVEFRMWSDNTGYWVYTTEANERHIIKYMKCKYYIWEGVDKGFSQQPIAKPLNAGEKRKHSRVVDAEVKTRIASSLRERTALQGMPYTAYNVQKKYETKGIQLTSSQLEDEICGNSKTAATRGRPASKKRKFDKVLTPDAESEDSHFPMLPDLRSVPASAAMPDEYILNNTVFRTRFSGFGRASVLITGKICASHSLFFEIVKRKWAFKLKNQTLTYCVAEFPWLRGENNLLLQESDVDGFDAMMEEVRSSPGWREHGRAEVTIEVCAESVIAGGDCQT